MKPDDNLSPHFKLKEFLQPGLTTVPATIVANLLETARVLEDIRKRLGNQGITITSGYRTPEYNRRIGGAPNSYHMRGKAVDFVVEGMTPQEVQAALEWWPGGLEYAPTWTHIDRGPKRRFRP